MKHTYFTCDKCGKRLSHLVSVDSWIVINALEKYGQTRIDLCEDCHDFLVLKVKEWASEKPGKE